MDFLSIRKKARKKGEAKEAKPKGSPAETAAPAKPQAEPAPRPARGARATDAGAAPKGEPGPPAAPEHVEQGPPPDRRRGSRAEEAQAGGEPAAAALQERFEGLAPSTDGRFATWRPGSSAPPLEPDQQALVPRTPEPPRAGETVREPEPRTPEAGLVRIEAPVLAPTPLGWSNPADPLDVFFYRPDEVGSVVPSFGGAAFEEPGLAPAETLEEFLTFGLGKEAFAVPIADVREVMRAPAITELPRAPAHVLGVITVRGEVVAVMDARGRLGLGGGDPSSSGRIVIVDAGVGSVGLLVDGVHSVVRLPRGSVEPCPQGIAAASADCVTGIGRHRDRLFMVIDPSALLSKPTVEG